MRRYWRFGRHTSARISTAEAAGWPLAKPYSFANAQPTAPLSLVKSDDTLHAAGSIVSTTPDLARFLIAQLSKNGSRAIPTDESSDPTRRRSH